MATNTQTRGQILYMLSSRTTKSVFAGLSLIIIFYITIVRNYIELPLVVPAFSEENSHPVKRDYQLKQFFNASVPYGSMYNKSDSFGKPHCLSTLKDLKKNVTVKERLQFVKSHPTINIQHGGSFSPTTCYNEQKVAIIVPYRDRKDHLELFLQHMHSFLQKQKIEYTIFVIEQDDGELFNRGLLFNVGFITALTKGNYSCFILHDVDLLPTNEYNIYQCISEVNHMRSSAMKHYYPTYFGGVLSISAKLYLAVNGFSNLYYGWGQEDDDFFRRVVRLKIPYYRHQSEIGEYEALPHEGFKGFAKPPLIHRKKLYEKEEVRHTKDGLNSVVYELIGSEERRLYTWYKVRAHEIDAAKRFYACKMKLWICDLKSGRWSTFKDKAAEFFSLYLYPP